MNHRLSTIVPAPGMSNHLLTTCLLINFTADWFWNWPVLLSGCATELGLQRLRCTRIVTYLGYSVSAPSVFRPHYYYYITGSHINYIFNQTTNDINKLATKVSNENKPNRFFETHFDSKCGLIIISFWCKNIGGEVNFYAHKFTHSNTVFSTFKA